MFSSQGIQPVTVVFNNIKNCFLHLPSELISHLALSESQALELSWGHGSQVFLSWAPVRASSSWENYKVELSRQLGEKLGLKDGEQGFLRTCHQVSSLHQVFVEPLSSDDWEILELHSAALEEQLLNQIRVVFQGAVFPLWVDNHTAIYIQIASLVPGGAFGRLEQFTELVVSPKIRAGARPPRASSAASSPAHHVQRRENISSTSSSGSSYSSSTSAPLSHSSGGIPSLRSLLRYVMKGTYDTVKEQPPVPDIPAILTDLVYRVCGAPPQSLSGMSSISSGVVHLFPLRHSLKDQLTGGKALVTYGLMSKVLSPKESKEKMKKAAETQRKAGSSKEDVPTEGGKEDEKKTSVVRVVCHNMEKMVNKKRSRGEIHSANVWIPQPLAGRLNIEAHSLVRIKPVKSSLKTATSIHLQPLKPLPEDDDDDIQNAFLGWLHTKSHEPLACLTLRSGSVVLHRNDDKSEFALSVLKPEPQDDPPDQLFLLAPTVLKNKDIQVFLIPEPTLKGEAKTSDPELPSLTTLGGFDELANTGFKFISHSLLGSPLSRELGTLGQGLGGGALLITGAQGCGKSTLSRALCRKAREDLDAHVVLVDCKKLQGKRAETVRQILQDTFEQAEWSQPSVVLLDDLDHLAKALTSPEHEHSPDALLHLHVAQSLKDVVDELVLQGSLVSLIITSHSDHSLHPSLVEVQGSHFIQGFVNIQLPNQTQRADILHHLILRKPHFSEETLQTLDLGAVAKETEGYTPQDLTLLLERATHANTVKIGKTVCLTSDDFAQALKGFTPPSLWGVDLHTPSGVGLEGVGGLKEVRQQLMDTILLPAKYPILFSKLPIRHRSGILLYGAPGTGKSMLARAVSKDSGMNFICIKGPELLSKYIGASEQKVREVFQRAQAAKPCILFFDEFDALAPRRGHDNTGVTDRVVNQLLTQLDGVEGLQGVYMLAATSRPDLIDPALLRPGRLDKCLYCPPPDQEARVEILRALSVNVCLAPDVDLEQLAAATERFTGADLKALLYNAQLEAIHILLGSSAQAELTSGSDSDMSLSSMTFPNNCSGSEDSVGDGELSVGLEQSMVLLEHNEPQAQDEHLHSNVWRLYFGSSYESDSRNSPISGGNSQGISRPTSVNQDSPAGSAREPISSLPLAYMPSIQRGYEELSHEQLERLQQDVNTIKASYKLGNVRNYNSVFRSVSTPALLLCQAHLNAALAVTRPSLSQADWNRYSKLSVSLQTSLCIKAGRSAAVLFPHISSI
uniref:Peroxisomal ATPase PEX1 n=1 Tax=Gouania willdenowi TaxID=441366 RepID=A0A8C5H322_GOUWI